MGAVVIGRTRIFQAPFEQTAFGYRADAEYRLVWEENTEGRNLAEIWERFQRVDEKTGPWPPDGYEGRSLSIGDLISIGEFLYTVEPLGFCEIGGRARASFWEHHGGLELSS